VEICVEKRDGSKESLCIDKIHKMLSYCSDGLDVSISDVAISAKINFTDNIKTKNIQSTLIRAAADKVSTENPDYDIFAGRLLASSMCREVYNVKSNKMDFNDFIKERIDLGIYSEEILKHYTHEDIELLESFIDYENNFSRGYASMVQLESKYLIKDAKTDRLLEMPQEVFMLIPMTIFAHEPNRTKLIIDFYTALKQDEISLPTPIIAGVRTRMRMYSSCCKIEMGDTIDGILSAEHALSLMTAKRAGIGMDMSNVRGKLAPVNKTVKHTGALPILKAIESGSKQFTQNSLRSGATVVNYPIWNWEIMDILEYKNNQGANTTRARFIDYSIGLPDIFIKRVLNKETFTIFSAEDVPLLFTHYGYTEEFNKAYEAYEKDTTIRKKVFPAIDIFNKLTKERIGTGRIYIRFDDNINNQGMFKRSIKMTNLCLTGDTLITVCGDQGGTKTMTLKELTRVFNDKDWRVWSYDIDSALGEWKHIDKAWLVSKQAKLVKVTFRGKSIKCTPDHRIYTQNRGYVKAKNLNIYDILVMTAQHTLKKRPIRFLLS